MELIIGPMFSGKTIDLVRKCSVAAFTGPCAFVRPFADTREDDGSAVSSHGMFQVRQNKLDGPGYVSFVRTAPDNLLGGVDLSAFATVGIDEGQFFPDLISGCRDLRRAGKRVIVAALDADFTRSPFPLGAEGTILGLIPHCTHVKKLHAVCECGKAAPHSMRLTDSDTTVLVGGSDAYRAVCPECYDSHCT